ncbi:MAG: VacJ family lipoprotein [Nitrospira sp.]|nr:VacJ family lipoprotein [Nitrospira sp.]MDH5254102.1 VacJ family lipoprotein [Nitrospira sp.]
MMAGMYGITIQLKGTAVGLALLVALLSFSGCAGQAVSKNLQPLATAAPDTMVGDNSQEEPFDPFAKPGELGLEEYDPWEPFNTKVFEFNRQIDRWVMKPVAKAYDFIMPNPVQVGISNFYYNARFVPRFVNNVLQGKVRGAGIEAGRFLVNTTVGMAGFIDWASDMNLTTPEEDLGQTLGFYGVQPGPYLVVPLYPPFTVRDFVGYVGDIFLNPIYWLALPIIEIGDIPSAIPHENRTTTSLILLGAKAAEVGNDRSLNLEKYQGVEESTVDLYSAVRNAYLQKRAKAIQE